MTGPPNQKIINSIAPQFMICKGKLGKIPEKLTAQAKKELPDNGAAIGEAEFHAADTPRSRAITAVHTVTVYRVSVFAPEGRLA